VRAGAVDAAKNVGDPNLLAPLVGALMNSDSSQIRVNAAEAIASVGDHAGVRYLVYRFEGTAAARRARTSATSAS